MQRRFRKVHGSSAAEVWLDVGLVGYRAELYEDGEVLDVQKGIRPKKEEIKVYLSGEQFSALMRLGTDGSVVCTWSR